ncbi:MAG: lamin tail domain-containing protein [Phycisphaerales bacterium]|nr:MAG: lamin tail domain-containing protein [Phycisphaerales bacterium]
MRVSLATLVVVGGFATGLCAAFPKGDLNQDCLVGYPDLTLLATWWLSDPNDTADPNGLVDPNRTGDLDGDDRVDMRDFAVLADRWGRFDCPIVINELLAHSHDTTPDWIELYNISSAPVDLGGWTLSDEADNLAKYRIPDGTIIEPNGYAVFYEDAQFGNPDSSDTLTPFRLSENGEVVYLYSGNDETFPDCLREEAFGASETDTSFGRYRKSTNTWNFVFMSEATPGAANAYPLVGPVVINEIMYRPAGDGDAEYVELLNISNGPVTFFDFETFEPWRFTDDTGIDFSFPTDWPLTIEAGQHVLLVRDTNQVRRSFSIPAQALLFEWDSGRLANSGEKIRLLKPGDVDEAGTRYWIEVDRVNYSDGSHGEEFEDGIDPWPRAADGLGPSLNRLSPRCYGNDPNNWQATIPTPGSAND